VAQRTSQRTPPRRTATTGPNPPREPRRKANPTPTPAPPPRRFRPLHRSDGLYPGSPDVSGFPRAAWLAASRRALAVAPAELFGYGDPRGCAQLREALAAYLTRARGVLTSPERIVVCSGVTQGLSLVSRVLRQDGRTTVAVESYGLGYHRGLIDAAGLRTTPLEVDQLGARTEELSHRSDVGAVLLTPAHQFPLGMPLHPDRRAAVVDWAAGADALILEDDYDGEFRFDRQPVGALQGLDPERVVYFGTASKSLAPALRLAWLALPAHLAERVAAAKGPDERHPSVLDQLTLAEFIDSGAHDRHVRSMRLRYRRRRDRLVAELGARVPDVRVSGIAAGLHAVLRLPPGMEQHTVRSADWLGLPIQGLDFFRHPDWPTPLMDGLVVGYGTPAEHSFTGALDTLCQVLEANF
jgi:GntR family transcriptional regulator/MocR family aminotransferase